MTPSSWHLSVSDWEFVDVNDVTFALGQFRLGSGQIRIQTASTQVGLDFYSFGAGLQGLPTPIPKGVATVEKLIRANLSAFIKLSISPSSTPLKVGSILKNPLNVRRELELHHFTEGLMVVFKGELGAVIPGIQGSLVFFGMPFSSLLNSASIVPGALIVPSVLMSKLLEGRYPLPNAIGIFGKTSTGIVGPGMTVSTGRITGGRVVAP